MKICQECHVRFEVATWVCPHCGFTPKSIDGFMIFNNEVNDSSGFNPELFQELFKLEAENFWFKVRNQIIAWALKQYFPDNNTFLEVGCGTGYVLAALESAFPQITFSGSEIQVAGLSFARSRIRRSSLWQMDARNIPFENHFGVIGAFDVLEHVKEDREVIAQMYQAIQPGGGVILTVPQHPFLWSYTDEHAHHERRYTAKGLKNKIREAGFEIVRSTSFVSFLLPLMLAARIRKAAALPGYDPLSELKINKPLNSVLESILRFEALLIRLGISFPFGGTLLLVAKKPEQP